MSSAPDSDISEKKIFRNDPFEVLSVFTADLTFETGVKVKPDLLVTPNRDVLKILGTHVMEENKVSICNFSISLKSLDTYISVGRKQTPVLITVKQRKEHSMR